MTQAYAATNDAWNRLVKLQQKVGEATQTVAEYQYDGRTFRVIEKTYEDGALSATRHCYFSPGWRVLEERIDSEAAADRHVHIDAWLYASE